MFGLPNKRWGLSLADGGTQRLPRVVGIGNALYMIETGIEPEAEAGMRRFVEGSRPAPPRLVTAERQG